MPARKFQHSAPLNVPMMPKKAARSGELADVEIDDDEGDDEMLPPHEIVARGSSRSPKTTFSVLEGVGRTLKGRDLRRVRNAVFRQTGRMGIFGQAKEGDINGRGFFALQKRYAKLLVSSLLFSVIQRTMF